MGWVYDLSVKFTLVGLIAINAVRIPYAMLCNGNAIDHQRLLWEYAGYNFNVLVPTMLLSSSATGSARELVRLNACFKMQATLTAFNGSGPPCTQLEVPSSSKTSSLQRSVRYFEPARGYEHLFAIRAGSCFEFIRGAQRPTHAPQSPQFTIPNPRSLATVSQSTCSILPPLLTTALCSSQTSASS